MGSGGCELRIEDIKKSRGRGGGGSVGGQVGSGVGRGFDEC